MVIPWKSCATMQHISMVLHSGESVINNFYVKDSANLSFSVKGTSLHHFPASRAEYCISQHFICVFILPYSRIKLFDIINAATKWRPRLESASAD